MVKVTHVCIVELIPLIGFLLNKSKLVLLFDIRVVVPTICRACVHDYANQVILVILCRLFHFDLKSVIFFIIFDSSASALFLGFFAIFLLSLFLIEVVLSVLFEVDLRLELKVVIQLLANHQVEIKVEALQSGQHITRHLHQAGTF